MLKLSVDKTLLSLLFLANWIGAQESTLKAAAEKVGLNIGFAVGRQISNNDQATLDLVNKHANILVNENHMKFEYVEPSRGVFDFTKPDSLVKFAEANGIKMRGHTLLWDFQIGWAGSLNTGRADVLKAIKTHIDSVVGYYKGRILEWDVVNEPFMNPIDSSKLRPNNPWMRNVGSDYIDSALVWANRADPAAKLFINDFWIEWQNPKSDAMYALVKRLQEKKIPIHGVGFQSHTGNGQNKQAWSKNIKRFGDLGLMVSLTEVDVSGAGNTSAGWKAIFEACLENANCTSFLTWGVDDSKSWLNKEENNFNCDCLLFDKLQNPKPHVAALISSMNALNPSIAAARKAFVKTTGIQSPQQPGQIKANLTHTQNEIRYYLDKVADVRLDILNPEGRQVASLVNTSQSVGMQSIAWDGNKVTPGLYLLKLRINDRQEIAKIIVGQ